MSNSIKIKHGMILDLTNLSRVEIRTRKYLCKTKNTTPESRVFYFAMFEMVSFEGIVNDVFDEDEEWFTDRGFELPKKVVVNLLWAKACVSGLDQVERS